MNNLMDKMLNYGMGDVFEQTRAELLRKDEVYQKDLRDLLELEERYEALELDMDSKMFINDYIACLNTVNSRAYEVSYMAGIKDTIIFLEYLGFLKNSETGNIGK